MDGIPQVHNRVAGSIPAHAGECLFVCLKLGVYESVAPTVIPHIDVQIVVRPPGVKRSQIGDKVIRGGIHISGLPVNYEVAEIRNPFIIQ